MKTDCPYAKGGKRPSLVVCGIGKCPDNSHVGFCLSCSRKPGTRKADRSPAVLTGHEAECLACMDRGCPNVSCVTCGGEVSVVVRYPCPKGRWKIAPA